MNNQLNETIDTKAAYLSLPDSELVVLCQRGDRLALESIVRRYQKIVISMLYQLAPDWQDITDLAQEVFVRVYKHIGSLRNPNTFRAWVNQITINLFYDELRKRPKRINTISLDKTFDDDDDQVREIPDLSNCPDEMILNKELSEFIHKAMNELPEQFKTVIVLRELQGLSYEEIAETLNCELGTVKSRIARARAKLQIMLKNYAERLPKKETKRKL